MKLLAAIAIVAAGFVTLPAVAADEVPAAAAAEAQPAVAAPEAVAGQTDSGSEATIIFIRKSAMPYAAPLILLVGGVEYKSKIRDDHYFEFKLPAGEHKIQTKFAYLPLMTMPDKKTLEMTVQAGQTRYVVLSGLPKEQLAATALKAGLMQALVASSGRTVTVNFKNYLTEIGEDSARELLPSMTRIEPGE